MRPRLLLFGFAFSLLVAVPSPAHAAWSPFSVVQGAGAQYRPTAVGDGASGAIVAWYDAGAIYAHHVFAGGVDPAWPANGRLVGTTATVDGATVVADGSGGAIIAWLLGSDYEVVAQHVLASGAIDPSWPEGGIVVCSAPGNQIELQGVSDGAGGAILVWRDARNAETTDWDIYAQRVLANGTVSWAANGVSVCSAPGPQSLPVAVSDGAGGIIVAWEDNRSGDYDVYAGRLTGTGALAAGWNADGEQLTGAADQQISPRICSDGAAGAIVSWADYRTGVDGNIYAMRIRSTGALGNGWRTDGEVVCVASQDQEPYDMIADGSGGAIISWADPRAANGSFDIYAQKLTAGGAQSWTNDGVPVCAAADHQLAPSLGPDGAGGAYVAWQDLRFQTGALETDIFLQHLTGTGAVAAGWPANGGRGSFGGFARFGADPQPVIATGPGNAIVFWTGEPPGPDDVFAMGITSTWTPRYALNVAVSPASSGSVAKNPDATAYVVNSTVSLTATPSTGYGFSTWSGDEGGSGNPVVVTMTSDKNVTANFLGHLVNVTILPNGSGTVTKSPDQPTYAPGSQVTLSASSSYAFQGWGGDASGTDNPLTITVDAAKNVTASFQAYTITTAAAPASLGSVTVSPSQSLYAPGSSVILTAVPAEGAQFSSWSGDLSSAENPDTVIMNGSKSITANFSASPVCGGWSAVPASSPPSARSYSSAIWDPIRHRLIVFGGGQGLTTTYTNDVWALSGGAWTQIAPTGTPPPPRIGAWACYDPVRDRMLVFGGSSQNPFGGSILGDLWALSLSGTPAWNQIVPAGTAPPGPRYSPRTIIYDPLRDRLLFFGGSIRCGLTCQILQNDTWQISLAGTPTWTQLSPTGTLPPASANNGAVYDPVRDRMLVYGSVGTWALGLAGPPAWSNLAPVGTLGVTYILGGAYDPGRDQVLVVEQGTCYVLDFKYGPMWTLVHTAGTMSRNTQSYPTVFNPDVGAVMIFGGTVSGSYANTALRLDLTGGNTVVTGAVNGSVIVDDDRWCLGSGETALLLAAPANGYQFSQWLGDASGNANTLHVPMTSSKVIRAEFVPATTDVEGPPLQFALGAVHPNPSSAGVSVEYALPREATVHLGVYDLSGRRVASLVDGVTAAGRWTAVWQGTTGNAPAPTGVYFVRLVTPAGTWVTRVSLVR